MNEEQIASPATTPDVPIPVILSGPRKAAILMVLLGEEPAAAIYKNLPDKDVETLTEELAHLERVPPEIAQQVRSKFPDAPIILLSDFWSPPADVAPFINQFIRKGEPAKLMEVLTSHFSSK